MISYPLFLFASKRERKHLHPSRRNLSTNLALKNGLSPRLFFQEDSISTITPNVSFKNSPSFPGQNPIRPRTLISPLAIHKLPRRIHLQAAEDVFRPGDPPVVGGVALIVDVDVSTSTSASGSTLAAGSPGAVPIPATAVEVCVLGSFWWSGSRCHGFRLRNHGWIRVRMVR